MGVGFLHSDPCRQDGPTFTNHEVPLATRGHGNDMDEEIIRNSEERAQGDRRTKVVVKNVA
jgi:hypothetical protein